MPKPSTVLDEALSYCCPQTSSPKTPHNQALLQKVMVSKVFVAGQGGSARWGSRLGSLLLLIKLSCGRRTSS